MRKVNTKNTKDTKKGFDFESFSNTTKDILNTMTLESLTDLQSTIVDQLEGISDKKLKNKVKTRLSWIDDIITRKSVDTDSLVNNIFNDDVDEIAVTTDSKPVVDKDKKKATTKKATTKKADTKKTTQNTKDETKDTKKDTKDSLKQIATKDMIKAVESGKQIIIHLEDDDTTYIVVHHDQNEKRLVLVSYTPMKTGTQLDTYICDYTKLDKEALQFHDGKHRDLYFIDSVYTK